MLGKAWPFLGMDSHTRDLGMNSHSFFLTLSFNQQSGESKLSFHRTQTGNVFSYFSLWNRCLWGAYIGIEMKNAFDSNFWKIIVYIKTLSVKSAFEDSTLWSFYPGLLQPPLKFIYGRSGQEWWAAGGRHQTVHRVGWRGALYSPFYWIWFCPAPFLRTSDVNCTVCILYKIYAVWED